MKRMVGGAEETTRVAFLPEYDYSSILPIGSERNQ